MNKLGGWWRLSAVATVLLTALAIIAAVTSKDLEEDGSGSPACIPGTIANGQRTETDWIYNPKYLDLFRTPTVGEMVDKSKVWDEHTKAMSQSVQSEYALPVRKQIFTISCASWTSLGLHLLIAIGLAFLAALLGISVRWIFRGFKI